MHFEILVEDSSGKRLLDSVIPRLIDQADTYEIHSYRGIGRLPKNLRTTSDPQKRILLDQLPRLLKGFGRTFFRYAKSNPAMVIVVCDLDRKCQKAFREELLLLLASCDPKPNARFCIAVEEMEAWLLADMAAVRKSYPHVDEHILQEYVPDSICDTWERLADAVYPGGSKRLHGLFYSQVGAAKHEWAEKIGPNLDIENSKSPSFCYFRDKIRGY